jgi:hypothetical protein
MFSIRFLKGSETASEAIVFLAPEPNANSGNFDGPSSFFLDPKSFSGSKPAVGFLDFSGYETHFWMNIFLDQKPLSTSKRFIGSREFSGSEAHFWIRNTFLDPERISGSGTHFRIWNKFLDLEHIFESGTYFWIRRRFWILNLSLDLHPIVDTGRSSVPVLTG